MAARLFDRLNPSNWSGRAFQRVDTKVKEQLEEVIEDLQEQISDLSDVVAALTIAQLTADARMPDVPGIIVLADAAGTVETNELPRNVQYTRWNATTDVSASSAWTRTLLSGNAVSTIGAATGLLEITGPTNLADSVIRITSVRNGITLLSDFPITKQSAGAPIAGGSGGGTTATDTSFGSINSTSHAAISDELTVTVGAGGDVDLVANLQVRTALGTDASLATYAIFKWWNGASWADVGTETLSSPDTEDVGNQVYPGLISISTQKTGLAPAATEKFQLYARNNSGTRVMTFTGTASATGV
jgi:hypothetical protein